jgi:hypothetical protein
VLALFSAFFPWYLSARGRARWADFYMPALSVVTSNRARTMLVFG